MVIDMCGSVFEFLKIPYLDVILRMFDDKQSRLTHHSQRIPTAARYIWLNCFVIR